MKNFAVVTIVIGKKYQEIYTYTGDSIRKYAEKIDADFICIDNHEISKTTPHWEKFKIFDLLNKYQRIIYLDSDLIIRDDCPNLFDIVPIYSLGVFNEAPFTPRPYTLLETFGVNQKKWKGKYYNTGVMVISRLHKELFKKPNKESSSFFEQSYLNAAIINNNISTYDLPYVYNRMSCMDKFLGEERHVSYILHYAGYPDETRLVWIIKKDLDTWQNKTWTTKKHIICNICGGIGDQLDAEPSIRYMINNFYSKDDVNIITHYPKLFEHLGVPIFLHGEFRGKEDIPYCLIESFPGPDTIQYSVISNLLSHSIDFISIAMLKRTLPVIDKQIKLKYTLEDVAEVINIIGIQNISDLVLIHPGKHWQSKTMPVQWWNEIISGLIAAGEKVCIIGKHNEDEECSGVLDIDIPEGCIDTRDLLSINGLIAIIGSAKMIITNDSAPVHIAGAFDNYIVVFPTAKHPDHILPWRNGSQKYKTLALYKKLAINDFQTAPTQISEVSADKLLYEWNKYLLEPKEIISKLMEVLNGN